MKIRGVIKNGFEVDFHSLQEGPSSRGPFPANNAIWNIFSSVKTTIALLIVLAVISVIGTLVPQQEEAVQFAQKLSPQLFRILSFLQIFDLYHSTWFRIIIGMLSVNLIICSLDRLPGALRLFRTKPRADRKRPFENIPEHRQLTVKGRLEDVTARTADILRKRFKKIEIKEAGDDTFLYGDKGRYSYFGAYIVHLSVLLILSGGIIGSIFGFEAYVNIPEGGVIEAVRLRKSGIPKNLGFAIRCDRFLVDFYQDGTPKEYRSDLSFLSDGSVILKGSVLVNHPITFKGITFYQSSYGNVPGDRVRIRVSQNDAAENTPPIDLIKGSSFELPGGEGKIQLMEISQNFRGMMGPAALLFVKPTHGDGSRFWVFQYIDMLKKRFPPAMFKAPILNPSSFKPYTFELVDIESKYYTGLQVNRDPGVPLVWIGCFLMVAGFFITFFASHRGVWIRITKKGESLRISVAGRTNRNPVGLERELDQLALKLTNQFKK
ncbi:MAG: cytochrome c biogenesis protein ResB [Deltaproteobacteria bacterium]|nr:cytochrome c biogenesis protein ResB [Deltaproteobacteria bacterium]